MRAEIGAHFVCAGTLRRTHTRARLQQHIVRMDGFVKTCALGRRILKKIAHLGRDSCYPMACYLLPPSLPGVVIPGVVSNAVSASEVTGVVGNVVGVVGALLSKPPSMFRLLRRAADGVCEGVWSGVWIGVRTSIMTFTLRGDRRNFG